MDDAALLELRDDRALLQRRIAYRHARLVRRECTAMRRGDEHQGEPGRSRLPARSTSLFRHYPYRRATRILRRLIWINNLLNMQERGVEPLHLAVQDPKSCASANSATPACWLPSLFRPRRLLFLRSRRGCRRLLRVRPCRLRPSMGTQQLPGKHRWGHATGLQSTGRHYILMSALKIPGSGQILFDACRARTRRLHPFSSLAKTR
jgi:hypothetical protein